MGITKIEKYVPIYSKDLTYKEKMILYCFKIAMLQLGWQDLYHLGNYSEARLCIYKNKEFWEVYTAERGLRFDRVIMSDLLTACIYAIKNIAIDDKTLKYAVDSFKELLTKEYKLEEIEDFVKYDVLDKTYFTEDELSEYAYFQDKLSNTYNKKSRVK